jgi:tetratricopeptide (TPR) repeat protein
VAREQGDPPRAQEFFAENLALKRNLRDTQGVAGLLDILGALARAQGDAARAAGLFEESAALHRELGDKARAALALLHQGTVSREQGAPRRAAALFEESLALATGMGDRGLHAVAVTGLAHAARDQGDYGRAADLYAEALGLLRMLDDKAALAACLDGVAAIACIVTARHPHGGPIGSAAQDGPQAITPARGALERAARLFGAAASLRDGLGVGEIPADRTLYDSSQAAARAALGDEAFAAAWRAGQAMTVRQAIAYALEESGPA